MEASTRTSTTGRTAHRSYFVTQSEHCRRIVARGRSSSHHHRPIRIWAWRRLSTAFRSAAEHAQGVASACRYFAYCLDRSPQRSGHSVPSFLAAFLILLAAHFRIRRDQRRQHHQRRHLPEQRGQPEGEVRQEEQSKPTPQEKSEVGVRRCSEPHTPGASGARPHTLPMGTAGGLARGTRAVTVNRQY